MKQKFLTAQLLLLSSLSLAYADGSKHYESDGSKRYETEEGLINPPSRFQVRDGCNMFLTADFLWWSANTDGLYYAQSNFGTPTTSNPPAGEVDFSGHMQRVKEEWGPGFRVGFGGNMPYDEWDIYLNWTWFHSDPKDSAKETSHGPLLVLWGHPDINSPAANANLASHAHARWDMTINVIDLEMGRAFWVGKHLSVHPFFAIRGAWIDQQFKVKYHYISSPHLEGRIKAESDFEGVGPRAGLDARFSLYNGWSIYGLVSAALMYGSLETDFRERENNSRIAHTDDSFHRGISTVQMGLGIRWDAFFHRHRYHVGVTVGWEQNIWYGVTQFNHYLGQLQNGTLVQNNGDLTLQGGTLSARFDF